MRVVVYGGRNYQDWTTVEKWLDLLSDRRPWGNPSSDFVVIEGGARGADEHAYHWAINRKANHEQYRADWETHGKAAGPIRNQRMIDIGRPDMGLAFPGGKGTADMTARLRKAKIPVMEIPE